MKISAITALALLALSTSGGAALAQNEAGVVVEGRGSVVAGTVVKLEDENQTYSVNDGGLVLIEIADLGSAPVEALQVKHSRAFQKLGQLQGNNAPGGGGGGYTLVLLKPVNPTDEKLTVTYKAALDPMPIKKVFHVKVK